MFNRKSDYARNKKQRDAIIYTTAKEQILLTRADFSCEEEFQKWKAWSDQYYHNDEQEGRRFTDQNVPVQDWENHVLVLFPSEKPDIQQDVTHDDLWYGIDLELTAAPDGRFRVFTPAGSSTRYFLWMEGSVMKMLLVFAAGLMVGGLFGVGIMCLMISAGRADDTWENRPHNSTTTKP